MKTILDLLKMGCSIQFPSGYRLVGDPAMKYIDCEIDTGDGYPKKDGVWQLNEQGLQSALNDADRYDKQTEN